MANTTTRHVLASDGRMLAASDFDARWFRGPSNAKGNTTRPPSAATRVVVPAGPPKDLITGQTRWGSRTTTPPRRSNPPKRVTPTATKATFVYHPKGLRDPAHVSVKETGSMPGYTGYIAGNHLIAGRSFGRASRRAWKHPSAKDLFERDLIPASPQLKDKLRVPTRGEHSKGVIPGYSGYVPSNRFRFGARQAEVSVLAGHTSLKLSSSAARKMLNKSQSKQGFGTPFR